MKMDSEFPRKKQTRFVDMMIQGGTDPIFVQTGLGPRSDSGDSGIWAGFRGAQGLTTC
jgi:hypothetical protein